MGLKTKGETADEITGIVRALKAHATVLPETFQMLFATVGLVETNPIALTFRLPFALFWLLEGIRMAKAGNRSVSSKSGSADVLEELGINVAASPENLSKAFDEVGLAFIFAQNHASRYALHWSLLAKLWGFQLL